MDERRNARARSSSPFLPSITPLVLQPQWSQRLQRSSWTSFSYLLYGCSRRISQIALHGRSSVSPALACSISSLTLAHLPSPRTRRLTVSLLLLHLHLSATTPHPTQSWNFSTSAEPHSTRRVFSEFKLTGNASNSPSLYLVLLLSTLASSRSQKIDTPAH